MTTTPIDDLNALLADYQVLYQRLRAYHWNVRGPMFFMLHARFEELYEDAALKVDGVAERVVALGGRPLATLATQLQHARLKEDGESHEAPVMVRRLVADYELLDNELRTLAKHADPTTARLLEEYADGQTKTVWMLKAFLES